jgi:hypothetical protein
MVNYESAIADEGGNQHGGGYVGVGSGDLAAGAAVRASVYSMNVGLPLTTRSFRLIAKAVDSQSYTSADFDIPVELTS